MAPVFVPFGEGVQIWTSRRQSQRLHAAAAQGRTKLFTVFSVAVHENVFLVSQESVLEIGQVAGDLRHPSGIGIDGDPGNLNPAGGQVDDEQNEESHESVLRPDFRGEEIRRRQTVQMRLDKLAPPRQFASFGRRFDALGE